MSVKVAIIYYSSTGTNYQLSRWAEEALQAEGHEVRVVRAQELAPAAAIAKNPAWEQHLEETKDVPVASPDDLDWADALIFSTPSRFGNVPGQIKQFLDTTGGLWFTGKLVNKVVSGMSSAHNPHGGQEATIKALYTTMAHWGAIIVPPGYTSEAAETSGGNPYGSSVTIDNEDKMIEDVEQIVKDQARRTAEVADWIKKGKQ
ncbi:NAD(P)H:quinone oxidoreductase [Virgibacillus sp. NKC19-3]|uniref:NAD(P)H:quinone oxidoreductase n=1 Tax=Virgibacillus saliphilus TaxID=2831674 RepID=UPI001C9B58CF|nr:NAD(P)H:quinone oxidoreductase [Virgibacillus sp. NKC19-3]MBY7145110.1 NAD(P)H:quinone oxidoreductase [Virgibacillus sp. NKC19-3]